MKRTHPPDANFMLSSVLLENSVNFSPPECLNAWTVYPSLHVIIWILSLCRPSDCDFIRLQSINSDILDEISSCEMRITFVLFHSCSVAFEKSFDDWTMILPSPLLITFARTKALALPPILPELWQFATKERSCPMACSKVFPWERLLRFWLSDWRNFTMHLFLNSGDGSIWPYNIIYCF